MEVLVQPEKDSSFAVSELEFHEDSRAVSEEYGDALDLLDLGEAAAPPRAKADAVDGAVPGGSPAEEDTPRAAATAAPPESCGLLGRLLAWLRARI